MSQQSANFKRRRQIAFGLYLRSLRKRVRPRLTQEQVAYEFHINLCDIEKGERPASVEVLINLAKKYGVPVEEILERKFSPQLPLLTGIIRPAEVTEELLKEIRPEEIQQIEEEVKRYTAFLILKRAAASRF
jgi:transcriptional regulator with XRE-family HTH domain